MQVVVGATAEGEAMDCSGRVVQEEGSRVGGGNETELSHGGWSW